MIWVLIERSEVFMQVLGIYENEAEARVFLNDNADILKDPDVLTFESMDDVNSYLFHSRRYYGKQSATELPVPHQG